MVFLIALACGIVYGAIHLIVEMTKTYAGLRHNVGKILAVVIMNIVILSICIFGGMAIEMSAGLILGECFIWCMMGNVVLLAILIRCGRKDDASSHDEYTPHKEDKRGTIEWDEEDE